MSLPMNLLLYLSIGCAEWWLALRRTLAVSRGERTMLVGLVFLENILGLWVLANFIRDQDWYIALAYSVGGALGALMVSSRMRKDLPPE